MDGQLWRDLGLPLADRRAPTQSPPRLEPEGEEEESILNKQRDNIVDNLFSSVLIHLWIGKHLLRLHKFV